jgi:hypothetical protein
MKFTRLLSGAALAAMLATTAVAQPAAPSANKIALAKQLVEASGGGDQMKTVLQVVFRSMSASLSANTPPEQKRLIEVLLQKMQDRFIAATPQLMDGTVQVYATNLTDKELRDYVAWLQSDTGQSLKRKLPVIAAESVKVMAPVIAQITQGMKQDVLDEACKQANCSAHDREVLAAALQKAMPDQAGANRPG